MSVMLVSTTVNGGGVERDAFGPRPCACIACRGKTANAEIRHRAIRGAYDRVMMNDPDEGRGKGTAGGTESRAD
jgi:hypothetical protein